MSKYYIYRVRLKYNIVTTQFWVTSQRIIKHEKLEESKSCMQQVRNERGVTTFNVTQGINRRCRNSTGSMASWEPTPVTLTLILPSYVRNIH
jgi:hypothetical protein